MTLGVFSMKDLYGILEIDNNATQEEIEAQYAILRRVWDPQKFTEQELRIRAESKMKAIEEAFFILWDEKSRKDYDDSFKREPFGTTKPKKQGVKQKPLSPEKKDPNTGQDPNHVWVLIAVVIFLLIMFGSIFNNPPFNNHGYLTATPNIQPHNTKISFHTKVPTKAVTPTADYGCIKWSNVTTAMEGMTKCVYGTIISTDSIYSNFHMRFSSNLKAFYFASGTWVWSTKDIVGRCYYAEGKLIKDTRGALYLNPGQTIYSCTSNMK